MPRNINPVPQWLIGGSPVVSGKMYYYESGTNTQKITYADLAETIENSWPVLLDSNGFLPNVFFSGSAKQILRATDEITGSDYQVFERDPVGDDTGTGSFDIYSPGIVYSVNNIIVTSTGLFYKSLANNNIGNDPLTDDGSNWQQIDFNNYWTEFVVFNIHDKAIGSDGQFYISLLNSNLGNDPTIDSGANWQLDKGITDWVIGRAYLGMEEVIGSNGRLYKAVTTTIGDDPTIDDGTHWLPALGKVQTPSNALPADAATGVSRTPTLTTSAFTVLGGTDTHEYSHYQLSDDSFATITYDSLLQPTDLTSHVVGTTLAGATEFSYRAKHKGVNAGLTDWSTVTTFTTTFPLSEFYSNDLEVGTGAARSVVNGIDLSVNTGAVLVTDTATATAMRVVDTQRGVGQALQIGVSATEVTEVNGLTEFLANGYSLGTDANYNGNTNDIYSLDLRAKEGFCDIVRYSGTGAGRTIAHNVNATMGFMFCLQETGAVPTITPWSFAWHVDSGALKYTQFGSNALETNASSVIWNSASPTSSVFSVGTSNNVNGTSRDYTMYLFANNPAAGVVCGGYTGTGASGNEIVTGTAVTTFLCKNKDFNDDWIILDTVFGTSQRLVLDSNGQLVAGGPASFNSNGITLNSDTDTNRSGDDYIYIAFGEKA